MQKSQKLMYHIRFTWRYRNKFGEPAGQLCTDSRARGIFFFYGNGLWKFNRIWDWMNVQIETEELKISETNIGVFFVKVPFHRMFKTAQCESKMYRLVLG